MTTPLAHPLVSAYLRDLELLLHGVEPVERAEVLGGVHEHLEASLEPGASEVDVRAVLAELGSPHSVADEAYAGRPGPALTAPTRQRPSPWLANVACFINAVGLVLLSLLALLGGLTSGPMAPHPAELILLGFAFFVPWLCLVVLTSMTDVWDSAEKLRSILLYPGTTLTVAATSWFVVGGSLGVLTFLVTVLVVAGGVWVLYGLFRSTRA